MNAQAWAGAAGLGGLSLLTAVLIFRPVIRKVLLSQLGPRHSFQIVRLLIVMTSIIALAGLAAFVYLSTAQKASASSRTERLLEQVAELAVRSESLDKAITEYRNKRTLAAWKVIQRDMKKKLTILENAKDSIYEYDAALRAKRLSTASYKRALDDLLEQVKSKEQYVIEFLEASAPPADVPDLEDGDNVSDRQIFSARAGLEYYAYHMQDLLARLRNDLDAAGI